MINQVFDRYAGLLKALADPRRLEIVHLLRDRELCVTDIYSMLDFPQANISQHLTRLREAGVVTVRRQGKRKFYSLADPRLIQAGDLLKAIAANRFPDLVTLAPLAHDPVCHMQIPVKTADFHTQYAGIKYYFCASGCLEKFTASPAIYV